MPGKTIEELQRQWASEPPWTPRPPREKPPDTRTPWEKLSRREAEIAKAIALGRERSEIAQTLGISVKTADTHRSHILEKLGLRNNVELARWMLKEGHVQL